MVEWDESHDLQKRFRTASHYISHLIKEDKKEAKNLDVNEGKKTEEDLVFLQ